MSFWKNIGAAIRGNKHEKEEAENEVVTAPASLDNMKVGSFAEFSYLPEQPEISGQSMEITAVRSFRLLDGELLTYAELENGAFFIRKEGRKVEVLQEYENNDEFLEAVNDDFHDVLYLDDHEWEVQDGVEVVVDNETEFHMDEDLGWAKTGKYRTVRDVMAAKFEGRKIRYIRSKSSDGQSFISVFYENGGDTFISSSCLVEVRDVEFIG